MCTFPNTSKRIQALGKTQLEKTARRVQHTGSTGKPSFSSLPARAAILASLDFCVSAKNFLLPLAERRSQVADWINENGA